MTNGYNYADVPGICEALQAEGLTVSIAHVRQRRGDRGSNAYISADIKCWKREHGLIEAEELPEPTDAHSLTAGDGGEDLEDEDIPTPVGHLPEPDPERVAWHLRQLEGETAFWQLLDHLQALPAAFRAVLPHGDAGIAWLYRQQAPLDGAGEYGRILSDLGSWGPFQRLGAQIAAGAAHIRQELLSQYRLVKGGTNGQSH